MMVEDGEVVVGVSEEGLPFGAGKNMSPTRGMAEVFLVTEVLT
jgi:hypothetical protein